jgi:hypothetical protein
MKKNQRESSQADSFDETLKSLKPEDFDGHTEFRALSPEQKLMWLSQAVQFYYKNKGKAAQKLKPDNV